MRTSAESATKVAFEISFGEVDAASAALSIGTIRIGDFHESFESSLEFWGRDEYERHWRCAVGRVLDKRLDSCLITSITDPQTANFLMWWPIYVQGDSVVFQNQIFFLHDAGGNFDIERPHRHLRPRETCSDDGHPISEWSIGIEALNAWMKLQKR